MTLHDTSRLLDAARNTGQKVSQRLLDQATLFQKPLLEPPDTCRRTQLRLVEGEQEAQQSLARVSSERMALTTHTPLIKVVEVHPLIKG